MELTEKDIRINKKETELGFFPGDWLIEEIINVGKIFKGKGIKKEEIQEDGIPCIRYGELYTRYHDCIHHIYSFIPKSITAETQKIKFGDILFAGSGETKEEIGKSAVLLVNGDVFAGGDIIILRPEKAYPIFLGYALNSIDSKKQKSLYAQGDAVVHIYPGSICKIKIPLPPTLTEQKAIATALSEVDALISQLDRLIAKKKAIKQGAMQQLLTGKKRLAGFGEGKGYKQTEVGVIPEDWEVKRLGEFSNCYSGGTPSTSNKEYYSGNIPWITSSELNKAIINHTSEFISTKGLENSSAKLVKPKTLLLALYGATAGVCAISNISGAINQAVLAIETTDRNTDFLFHYFRLKKENIINIFTQGGQPNLSGNTIKSLLISIPSSQNEIDKIIKCLNSIDLEISIIFSKKTKYQQIKQGMMQKLLTGKTRLV